MVSKYRFTRCNFGFNCGTNTGFGAATSMATTWLGHSSTANEEHLVLLTAITSPGYG
jgi:hypothetical protein